LDPKLKCDRKFDFQWLMNCAYSFKFEFIHYISACLFKSTGIGSNKKKMHRLNV